MTAPPRPFLAVLALVAAAACVDRSRAEREARALTGGDPDRGRDAIRAHGCGSCHAIPGVPGANATVGPPLGGIASRSYIAGRLPNTPENLVRWLLHPHEVDPQTAMPELGVTDGDARDVAAYLETLR